MPVSLLPSFLSFCFINGITPGPANLCSLSTAMNEGKQAALRQWRGLFTGFALVSLGSVLVNAFLGNVLGTHVRYLAWAGAAYLLWMAWNMIRPVFFPGFAEKNKLDMMWIRFIVYTFCITHEDSLVCGTGAFSKSELIQEYKEAVKQIP